MAAFQNDSATAWAWETQRHITIVVNEDGDRASAILSMPAARELLNELTAAIAQIDARDRVGNSDEALAALRVKLGC